MWLSWTSILSTAASQLSPDSATALMLNYTPESSGPCPPDRSDQWLYQSSDACPTLIHTNTHLSSDSSGSVPQLNWMQGRKRLRPNWERCLTKRHRMMFTLDWDHQKEDKWSIRDGEEGQRSRKGNLSRSSESRSSLQEEERERETNSWLTETSILLIPTDKNN